MAPPPKKSYELIIAGVHLPIDWPTYTFLDADPGFDATLEGCTHHARGKCGKDGLPFAPAQGLGKNAKRYRPRHIKERSLAAAQAIIKQFVVHLDGCTSAEMCFDVLHNERGLSCHFILDNDGTLYQTLDLIDCGYHAAGLNETSIGIEISNRGDAKKERGVYNHVPADEKRDVVTCTINDSKYVAYDFTARQYEGMAALGRALARYLPGIKLTYPQDAGQPAWRTLYRGRGAAPIPELREYSGYLGHYHITERKWDPGPFDFKGHITKLAGRRSFPIGLHGQARVEVPDAPPLTSREERAGYLRAFQPYYENNEIQGNGGFFPLGPLDHYTMYHGGIHLHAAKGTPVVAPFAGNLVLARNGPTREGIGSVNFVLLAHSIPVGGETVSFYTVFFHLAEEDVTGKKSERLKWMAAEGWENAEAGRATLLHPPEPIQAGDVIGRMGIAGPDGEPQLHWEIFTVDHTAVKNLDSVGFWKVYDGGADRRYCTLDALLDRVETRRDGNVTRQELLDLYRGDEKDKAWTREAVTFHYSEWSELPDWGVALVGAPEYKNRSFRKREIEEMVDEQIIPTIWWRDDVADRLKLPREARIYTYHPVSFLRWMNDLVGTKTVELRHKATDADYDIADAKAQLDIDDKDGTSFVNEADLVVVNEAEKLQLRDLVDGYGD